MCLRFYVYIRKEESYFTCSYFFAASDFQPENRTLTFSSGDESASVLILIINDEEYEGVEEFYSTLTTADSGVRIFAPDATIEIIDDG